MNTLDIMDVNKMKKRTLFLVISNSALFIFNLIFPIFLLLNYMETDSRIVLFFSGISLGFTIEYNGRKIKQFFIFLKCNKSLKKYE